MTDRMVRWAGILGTLPSLVPTVAFACAVCFVDSSDNGYYVSTLFLMAMPYTLIGSIGGWLFLRHRAGQGRPVWAAIRQRLRQPWGQRNTGAWGVSSLLWGGFVAVLITVVAAGVWSLWQSGRATSGDARALSVDLLVYSVLPDFRLLERSGRAFGLADLRGTVWVANFFFTHCTDVCPLETAEMAKLQAEFAGEPDLRFVSISVDPARDTPQVLAHYAEQHGADPERWLFLTGPKETIYRLAQEGFKLSVEDAPAERPSVGEPGVRERGAYWPVGLGAIIRVALSPTVASAHHGRSEGPIHSARFVLVDRQGRIRGYFSSGETEALLRLRQAIARVLQER